MMLKTLGINTRNPSYENQLETVYKALKTRPMTMKELYCFTGIMRENICRYINKLVKEGKVAITGKRKCSVTGHNYVAEYTSNESLFPIDNQLKLF